MHGDRTKKTMRVTTLVKDDARTVINLPDGATIEPLTPSSEDAYCVFRGTIPPGVSVPLHSHADAESFYVLSGEAEALVQIESGLEWQVLRPGDFLHIPGGTKHAWRNLSREPMSALITLTAKLCLALREMGELTSDGQFPSAAAMQHLAEISDRYGYWLGSREENAAVGIVLA
jgi:quercetin dioxygenase-like cupin family protein